MTITQQQETASNRASHKLKEGLLVSRLQRLTEISGRELGLEQLEAALDDLEACEMLFEGLPPDVKRKYWGAFENAMDNLRPQIFSSERPSEAVGA